MLFIATPRLVARWAGSGLDGDISREPRPRADNHSHPEPGFRQEHD